MQVYNFVPDVLTQLSGLGHGEVAVCLIVRGQVQLIQVMSGEQEGFLKKNNRSVGVEILNG